MRPQPAVRQVMLGLALLVAVLPPLLTWSSIVRNPQTLVLAAGAALAVLATGIVCRALRVPDVAVTLAELAVLGAVLVWLLSSMGGLLKLPSLVSDGIRRFATTPLPVAASAGTTVVVVVAVGLLAVLTDVLAVGLDRPLAALGPMLVLLLLPALTPKIHVTPALGTTLFAAGVAALLLASNGRSTAGRRRVGVRVTASAAAAVTAALALGAAQLIAPAVPVPPSTRGSDGEPIQMADVSLSLKRDIQQGANIPALDYTTDGSAGAYLRLYSLPTFNSGGWHLIDSSVQLGRLAPPPGLVTGTPRRTTVTITGFKSEWLPAPYAPTATSAGDQWGYLPDSLSILALGIPDRTSATRSLTYTVDSLDARPSADELASAQAGAPPNASLTASVPSDISPALVRIAHDITRGASTPGAKAQAILAYLALPRFTYSLDAQSGSGYQGLEDFLLKDHKGFCVQYAASMAILARIEGIPSRVAIGFTPGRRVGDHWTVTMHDMHAWPELYFEGWGWVSFEPTPGVGAGATSSLAPTPSATPSPTPSGASAAPSTGATASASPRPTPRPASGVSGWGLLLVALAVAGAAGVGMLPWWLRGRRRRERLAVGRDPALAALDAFDEVRATARDLGRPWPDGSPRFAAGEAASWVDRTAAADGVLELGLAAERAWFGGPSHAPQARDWTPVASAFTAELTRRTPSRLQRWRARLLPASLLG